MNKINNSYKCCILCLKSPVKVPNLKLHRFPMNEKKRNIWLNACGLEVDEYLPNRRLCSRHFDGTCYNKSGSRLKPDAIPTKYLKGQIIRPFIHHSKSEKMTENVNVASTSKINQLSTLPSTSKTENETISSEVNEMDQATEIVLNSSHTSELGLSTNSILSSLPSNELTETPKKKKRFVGQIKTPDLATPKRARKSFILAKIQIQKQKHKIKILNQKVRRLNEKLSSLLLLLSHLKQNNLLSEEAHDNILDTTNDEP